MTLLAALILGGCSMNSFVIDPSLIPDALDEVPIAVDRVVRSVQAIDGSFTGSSFSEEHPKTMPDKLEAGTPNIHGIAGLNASLKLL